MVSQSYVNVSEKMTDKLLFWICFKCDCCL